MGTYVRIPATASGGICQVPTFFLLIAGFLYLVTPVYPLRRNNGRARPANPGATAWAGQCQAPVRCKGKTASGLAGSVIPKKCPYAGISYTVRKTPDTVRGRRGRKNPL